MKKRSPLQSSIIVEKTITEIRSKKPITSSSISEICLKHDVDEIHIRNVAGWNMKRENNLKFI